MKDCIVLLRIWAGSWDLAFCQYSPSTMAHCAPVRRSSYSFSSSNYRSTRSSPSPPQKEAQNAKDVRQQPSPIPERDKQHQPLVIGQSDSLKSYLGIESLIICEGSMFGTLGTLPEWTSDAEHDHIRRSPTASPATARVWWTSTNFTSSRSEWLWKVYFAMTYSSVSQISSQESNNLATPIKESHSQFFDQLRASSPYYLRNTSETPRTFLGSWWSQRLRSTLPCAWQSWPIARSQSPQICIQH